MKISILLPYKENYSPEYPGAVSLFVNSTTKLSKFKSNITVFGSTDYKNYLSNNYIDISLKKNIFSSQTKQYIENFIKTQNSDVDLIEVHNRPNYISQINFLNKKLVLYFHNDPNTMLGSKTVNEKIELINSCNKIIFNSHWSKNQFIKQIPLTYKKSEKLIVIYQSIDKKKITFKKKENLISFVGKLNSAKGYDIFGKAIVKILDKYPSWKAHVIGDEPREKFNFNHKNLNILGFKNHNEVLKNFEKTNIAVVCSRWNEPFGRTSLEASSRGCAVIISDRGGLPETISNGIILTKLDSRILFKEIERLIIDKQQLLKIQKKTLSKFYLTDNYISKKIDDYRSTLLRNSLHINLLKNKKKLKILHITNFNERHNGRLFYNSGRRINNGFIRLNHSVLELSDRDIVSYSRKLTDLKGAQKLNTKFIETVSNYMPDLIVFGHADLIDNQTIEFIKKNHPNIKMCQWFLDRMDGEWKSNKVRFTKKMHLMDANFCTTDPKSLNFDKKKPTYYMPNCVDPSLEKLKTYNNKFYKSDVFFAMSHGVHRGILKKGKVDAREHFINDLIKITPNIKFDYYGLNNIQPIWSEDYLISISQNKIGLNLSQGKPSNFYSSDRFSQLIGNGLLVMIDVKTKIGNFFTKNEIITYNNKIDLSEKILKYTRDDKIRKVISKKGRDKYFKYFNSTIIAEFIINKTYEIKKKYYWENFL